MFAISKAGVYGLRAVIYLALQPNGEYVSISQIAAKLDISFTFLTKVLQTLTQNGILKSVRGPKGGVAFNKTSESVTSYDVIVAIDSDSMFKSCILALPGCSDTTPCPLHAEWSRIRSSIRQMFASTTVAALAQKVRNEHLRLSDVYADMLKST